MSIMLFVLTIAGYLKILTDDEVKDIVVLNLQKENCVLNQVKKNIRKVAESFYTFSRAPDEVRKYVGLIEKVPERKIMM